MWRCPYCETDNTNQELLCLSCDYPSPQVIERCFGEDAKHKEHPARTCSSCGINDTLGCSEEVLNCKRGKECGFRDEQLLLSRLAKSRKSGSVGYLIIVILLLTVIGHAFIVYRYIVYDNALKAELAIVINENSELRAPARLWSTDSLKIKEVINDLYEASTNQNITQILEHYNYPIRKWYNYLDFSRDELQAETASYFNSVIRWEKNHFDPNTLRIKVVGKEYHATFRIKYEVYQLNRMYHRYLINIRIILNEQFQILEIDELSREKQFSQYYPN